jgi:very-short-patch-repair endonuclease
MTCQSAEGMPIVPPSRALGQAASILSFRELVVAFDHLLNESRSTHRTGGLPPVDPEAVLREHAGHVSKRLRAACQFARFGSESRMETLTRLELARVGLASSFESQVDVFDDAGDWIGRFDLVDRQRKLIIEYDGEQHRIDRKQYLKDLRRLERARAAGYRVIRLHREDLLERPLDWVREVAEILRLPLRPVAPALMRFFEEDSR